MNGVKKSAPGEIKPTKRARNTFTEKYLTGTLKEAEGDIDEP